MLPAVAMAGIGLLAVAEGFGYACVGGMTYAFGRKFGRRVCEVLDGMEGKAVSVITNNIQNKGE